MFYEHSSGSEMFKTPSIGIEAHFKHDNVRFANNTRTVVPYVTELYLRLFFLEWLIDGAILEM